MAIRHPVVAKFLLNTRKTALAEIKPREIPRLASDIQKARDFRLAPNSASNEVAPPNSAHADPLNDSQQNQKNRRHDTQVRVTRQETSHASATPTIRILVRNAIFRPARSPKCPKMNAPSTRAGYPAGRAR